MFMASWVCLHGLEAKTGSKKPKDQKRKKETEDSFFVTFVKEPNPVKESTKTTTNTNPTVVTFDLNVPSDKYTYIYIYI